MGAARVPEGGKAGGVCGEGPSERGVGVGALGEGYVERGTWRGVWGYGGERESGMWRGVRGEGYGGSVVMVGGCVWGGQRGERVEGRRWKEAGNGEGLEKGASVVESSHSTHHQVRVLRCVEPIRVHLCVLCIKPIAERRRPCTASRPSRSCCCSSCCCCCCSSCTSHSSSCC